MNYSYMIKGIGLTFVSGALIASGLLGCSGGKDKPGVELIQDMLAQRNLKSQGYDYKMNHQVNRVPPEGTVPRGFTPYKYAGDAEGAEKNLVNPLVGPAAEALAARGADRFKVYCSACHGFEGKGDGTVAQYMSLKPPSLMSDKVRAFKDGRIFHIITDGQGLMNTYATQINKEEDRWAIVNYVRSLQKR